MIKENPGAGFFSQKPYYQQLADNGSKRAYLPANMRLMTSARCSAHQKSEFS
jgi:hypothetical protein